jgi:hypothetical protein
MFCRLEVAMDDPFTVGGIEGVRNVNRQRQNQFGRHRLPGDLVAEGPFFA